MKKWIFTCVFSAIAALGFSQTALTESVDFTVQDVNLQTHHLNQYLTEDKHVVLSFFITDCQPCIDVLGALKETYWLYGDNQGDVIFLAIENGHTNPEVAQFAQQHSLKFPVISGDDGGGNDVTTDYQIGAHPTVILINPDKDIVYQDMYPITVSNMVNMLTQAGLDPVYPVSAPDSPVESKSETSARLFPNPARSFVQMEHYNTEHADRLEILNTVGEIVEVRGFQGANEQQRVDWLPLDNLRNGFYYVRMMAGSETVATMPLIVSDK